MTLLPSINKFQRGVKGADYIAKIHFTAGVHVIQIALEHEWFTAWRIKYELYEDIVMRFGTTNGPETVQRESNRIL